MIKVLKRTGSLEEYDGNNIEFAVTKAVRSAIKKSDRHLFIDLPELVEDEVFSHIDTPVIHVDTLHELVENTLMSWGIFDVAREYIGYRAAHMPDIFRPRKQYRPFEYPKYTKFVDAMHNSFWTFRHFNYSSDVQDFKVHLTDHERTVATRAMLAIGQIESAVKTFWGNIGNYIQKPEIQEVGATFADSEVRHAHAYTHLLEILGLNDEFSKIDEYKPLAQRREHLAKRLVDRDDRQSIVLNILLFSCYVENVSLFPQFAVMMGFKKFKNRMEGLNNAIEATSKEEDLHFQFGQELLFDMIREDKNLLNDSLKEKIRLEAAQAINTENKLIRWMFDGKDLDFMTISDLQAFAVRRLNTSLAALEIEPIHTNFVDEGKFIDDWFKYERILPMLTDFFASNSTDYAKGMQSFNEEDLF